MRSDSFIPMPSFAIETLNPLPGQPMSVLFGCRSMCWILPWCFTHLTQILLLVPVTGSTILQACQLQHTCHVVSRLFGSFLSKMTHHGSLLVLVVFVHLSLSSQNFQGTHQFWLTEDIMPVMHECVAVSSKAQTSRLASQMEVHR